MHYSITVFLKVEFIYLLFIDGLSFVAEANANAIATPHLFTFRHFIIILCSFVLISMAETKTSALLYYSFVSRNILCY